MDLNRAYTALPQLKQVESELAIVNTMLGYASDKTPIKDAMLEVRTMSGWQPATIKQACASAMDILAAVFEEIMTRFNQDTEADVDSISLAPFEARFRAEIKEQEQLRSASLHVIEMASRVAIALNIPIPAAPASGQPAKPKKKFGQALLSLVVETDATHKTKVVTPVSWLTEAVLREDDPSVQKLALLDSKLEQTKSAEAVRQFAGRFNLKDADLADVILDVVQDARAQIAQSDQISQKVTAEYNQISAVVTAILDVRDGIATVNSYISGK